ncbi:helix-turn-helix transcriptional regulator [Pedobacter sp.]|uniref:helix-turn-helix transcriptional regulator n=1 Tax=Pedobacter sp. TaxID=1411316 RepID=UPI003D7F9620
MDETPKRFDRIVAILIQLQSKRIVKAQELAGRFEVSLRTIYRDIRTLEASGVPIYSEAGIGYSLMEGYRLPPVMFSREEASSFIAAEKLMQKFTDQELRKHYASATYKLKAVLQSADKDWISSIETNVLMQPGGNLFNEKAPDALALLFKSIAEKKQVIIYYKTADADEALARRIEPVGVFHDHDNWYALGYCHLRQAYRQFRTDRICQINLTENAFTLIHQPLQTYLQRDESACLTTEVVILVDKKIRKHLEYEMKYHGFITEKSVGDKLEMTFLARDINEGFARWYLMFGDYASIITPEQLKNRVLEIMDKVRCRINANH